MVVPYTTCMFHGSRRRKHQVLICTRVEFQGMNKVCGDPKICARHLKWRPAVAHSKVLQFTTGDEGEYPLGFCEAYAECLVDQPGGIFTEVFSGPNAPLSAAICHATGQDLPGYRVESSRGITNGAGRNGPIQAEFHRGGASTGLGKRNQLIPDGLNSCMAHLREAMRLNHPFRGSLALNEDHRFALEEASLKAGRLQHHRLGVLAGWKRLVEHETIVARQSSMETDAATTARRLGPLPKAALMEFLADRFEIEDRAVPRLCLVGMPIVGEASTSPFFDPFIIPAQLTVKELLATARQRRRAALMGGRIRPKLSTTRR